MHDYKELSPPINTSKKPCSYNVAINIPHNATPHTPQKVEEKKKNAIFEYVNKVRIFCSNCGLFNLS